MTAPVDDLPLEDRVRILEAVVTHLLTLIPLAEVEARLPAETAAAVRAGAHGDWVEARRIMAAADQTRRGCDWAVHAHTVADVPLDGSLVLCGRPVVAGTHRCPDHLAAGRT